MSPPIYHLRPNKAVDRLMFVDAIRRVDRLTDLADYSYFSLGGPYLEDFRLIYEINPAIRLTSIDGDEEVIKRQRFHLPCAHLLLKKDDLRTFITEYESHDKKSIFWLDYTKLRFSCFEDFMALLPKVAANSIVKISLRCQPNDYRTPHQIEEFWDRFGDLAAAPGAGLPPEPADFAALLQKMIRVASQLALPGATGLKFQPLCSFHYSDGTPMLTVTGIVCLQKHTKEVRAAFKSWTFANLDWARARRIDMPYLTTKERLHLQAALPRKGHAGQALTKSLGYLIDENRRKSEAKLKQYAEFHRYSPYYMRSIP